MLIFKGAIIMYENEIKEMEKYAEENNIPIMKKRGIRFSIIRFKRYIRI